MQQYQFIVPIRRDSDGELHSWITRNGLHDSLLSIAGGFTTDPVNGFWKNDAGKIVQDSSLRYTVAIKETFPITAGILIKRIVKDTCETFDQQCIYLAHPDGFAELVYP